MGNCNSAQCSGDLRLVTASVQVLGFSSVDDQPQPPAPSSTAKSASPACLLHKKLSASLSSLHSPPPTPTTLKKCPSTDSYTVTTATLSAQPPVADATATTTTTSSSISSVAGDAHHPTTTEIVLASPLPHSRFCKRLRMRRTADWDRVVMPLVTPGARLKVVYNPATLMIHVLERDDSVASSAKTTSGAKAKAR